jgi:hypothetical protein
MKTEKLVDEKFFGREILFIGEISTKNDSKLAQCLNWYSYMAEDKSFDKWLTEYMKKSQYSKQDIAFITGLDVRVKRYAAIFTRMETNGTIFTGELAGIVKQKLEECLAHKAPIKEEPTVSPNVISIQQRVKSAAVPHINHVDDEIFTWYQERMKKINFSLYDYIQKQQLSAQVCNHIKAFVQKQYVEHTEMMEGSDEQLNEAYAYLPAASKKEIFKQLKQCIDDIDRYIGNNKAAKVKKPRQKKAVSVEKQINSLKYQKEYSKLKIKSIAPDSIVGAQQLWVYNTKYAQLIMYNAIGPAGLAVKGTTLINFDPDSSIKKKLRKPEETIDKVLNSGKIVLKKIMADLKTKPIDINGRINDDCVLLKAIR